MKHSINLHHYKAKQIIETKHHIIVIIFKWS